MQRLFLFVSIVLLVFSCKVTQENPIAIKQLSSPKAMVVSAHPWASKIGTDIMKKGGNAVDAMVASQFALSVVYPRAGNIGGGGFMIIQLANGETTALDYREMAPQKAHKNLYLDSLGNVVPKLSTYGGLAVGVPGTVAGLYAAWQKYGKIKEWKTLVMPAVLLAQNGFKISKAEASRLNKYQESFIKYNPDNKVFIKEKWQAGDVLVQKDLAQTLLMIAQEGPKGFYEGEVARALVDKVNKSGGIISINDLKNYQAKFRKPIRVDYRGYEIISMPPPSSGGIAVGQLLKIVEKYPLKSMGFHSLKTIQLMVEAEKRVFADRAKYLGDNDFYPVPKDKLLSERYLQKRMQNFSFEKATTADSIFNGKATLHKESFETTHTSIIDADGMAVSCTTTLNSNFGSKVIVDKFGFFLNNEMDDFSAKPGVPNQFGLIGAEANAIAPKKRMLSSMTPTIVSKNGKVFLIVGTPGGSTIITSVFQIIVNTIDFDMDIYDAVQAKRFHHQFLPDRIMFEKDGFTTENIDSLQQKGYSTKQVRALGYVKAILIKNGQIQGSGDQRNMDDAVSGF
jgi:gamma-glutamyltranspeptidase/glutathione hydrolase